MSVVSESKHTPRSKVSPALEGEDAAVRLGRARRQLLIVSSIAGPVVAALPYFTGSWETVWYAMHAAPLPFAALVALFLALFQAIMALVLLPLSYYGGFAVPHAFGLSRQTFGSWLLDWLKVTGLGGVLGIVAGGFYLWATANSAAWWWVVFGGGLSLASVGLVFVMPYVVLALFFRVQPLADPETVARIRSLSRRAGAEVRAVCTLDFSRRTNEGNAAVMGLGRSRRLLLADTLLQAFSPDEVDAVVAHELGHHVHGDVPRLLGLQLGLMWVGLGLGAWLAPGALPVLSLPRLDYVPGFPEVFALAEIYLLATVPIASACSRAFESSADRFALETTENPTAFAAAMRRLAAQNLIEMRPPRWFEVLIASHPSIAARIGAAEAFACPG